MPIRVTQHTMYNNMVGNMQKNLAAYMESVQQGSSQKKINRPSDDPAGTYRVLTTRIDITSTEQYQENVDTAKGWLNLADEVLSTQVTTAIIGLKTLAEQASTGTYDASKRKIMADQARQYFGQLLNLSNTQFEDKSIFGGHVYDKNAFEEGLAITTWDDELYDTDEDKAKSWNQLVKNGQAHVHGAADTTIMVQFLKGGELLGDGSEYRYSTDGGVTWLEGNVENDPHNEQKWRLNLDPAGAYITVNKFMGDANGEPYKYVTDNNGNYIKDANGNYVISTNGQGEPIENKVILSAPEEDTVSGTRNGTTLYIRPTAFYQGDDKDPPVDVTVMDGGELTSNDIKATGTFGKNVLVRIDGQKKNGEFEDVDFNATPPQNFYWSYSTDGGANWVTATGMTTADGTVRLPIPGGYVDFDSKGNENILESGTQIVVHPSRADLDYEIMKDTYLSVNSVGKDVFGGYYEGKPALNGNDNLFEVVGAFIGYLEGNVQEGCQRTLAALTTAEEKILSEATRIGGMETRLEMAEDVLSFQKLDQQERLSYVEDIDLTELLTKLTRQQLTYQTVLQSSSMIMKLSLANYV